MFKKTALPFPLAYETTVFESKLNCWWGGVGKGKPVSSENEIQPLSPWLLVDLNLGKKKRECRFFKDSDKKYQDSVLENLTCTACTKIFWVRWCLITSRYTKELVQRWKKSSRFWVILMPS